jgi:UDP-N-acetylmuramoyl-tripeptide--D-alanyl-D-alanine ligase
MAKILGVHKLPKELKNPIHRLSLIVRGDMTIIDDAYSSNTDGFAAAVKYLKSFDGWKVIVTPGIPELGSETYDIHKKLGKQLTGLDKVILVGKNDRTRGLADGYQKPVVYIEKVTEAISRVSMKKAVILFENDLPDNY